MHSPHAKEAIILTLLIANESLLVFKAGRCVRARRYPATAVPSYESLTEA
jgi:hypothetical protein